MNDSMNEYDIPQFPGDEEEPQEELNKTESASPEEPVEASTEIIEGTMVEEPETVTEKKPPTKLQRTVHTVSTWALAILGFALVLYLVLFFFFYQPLRKERDAFAETNATLEVQLADTREELEAVNSELAEVTAESDQLLLDTEDYQGYVHFLNLKNDLLLLQKAYLEQDQDGATLAKSKATGDLEAFVPFLTGTNEPMVDVLRGKIALLSTVEADTAANIDEVETIYAFLLELEDDIFGELE